MGHILFADDDGAMRSMVADMLLSAGHSALTVSDGNEALAAIRETLPELVILDYRMGDPDGLEVCRRIKQNPKLEHLPVLILTGQGHVEDRIRGFGVGANDYLVKPFDTRELLARVEAMLRLSDLSRSLNPTTGLPGGDQIEKEFERRQSSSQPFTLCYIDLDNFKAFNDRFGFPTANSVIQSFGQELRSAVAGTDHFAGHIGGDDFVLMCDREAARPLVEEVQRRMVGALPRFLPPEVIATGSYIGKLRSGQEDMLPLTRAVAALLHLSPGAVRSLSALGETAAEAKDRAKNQARHGIVELEIEGLPPVPYE